MKGINKKRKRKYKKNEEPKRTKITKSANGCDERNEIQIKNTRERAKQERERKRE